MKRLLGIVHNEDNFTTMSRMADNSIDSIVTDAPYGLKFMGKKWDYQVPSVQTFQELLRVAKPGAILLCFGGSRTFHRMAINIEDAGWELRDTIMWVYGSGFPKSLDISKAIDKAAGAEREIIGEYQYPDGKKRHKNERTDNGTINQLDSHIKNPPRTAPNTDEAKEWQGYGTALKPAFEPIIVAMKPLDGTFAENALKWGVSGLNIDECRVEATNNEPNSRNNKGGEQAFWGNSSINIGGWDGTNGRFPANFIHDGSNEVIKGFPVTASGKMNANVAKHSFLTKGNFQNNETYGDIGSASRFFYCAKVSPSERTCNGTIDNEHPTVKPLELMRYLVRLTKTPTGGIVYDPFAGSGTTLCACVLEGREFIGSEMEEQSAITANERIKYYQKQVEQKAITLFEQITNCSETPNSSNK